MLDELLRFVDNLGLSLAEVLQIAIGATLGSIVWLVSPDRKMPDGQQFRLVLAKDIGLIDFFRRVTFRTGEGWVVIVGSAINVLLAAILALFPALAPYATLAVKALVLPLALVFLHIGWSGRWYPIAWVQIVALTTFALWPTQELIAHLVRRLG